MEDADDLLWCGFGWPLHVGKTSEDHDDVRACLKCIRPCGEGVRACSRRVATCAVVRNLPKSRNLGDLRSAQIQNAVAQVNLESLDRPTILLKPRLEPAMGGKQHIFLAPVRSVARAHELDGAGFTGIVAYCTVRRVAASAAAAMKTKHRPERGLRVSIVLMSDCTIEHHRDGFCGDVQHPRKRSHEWHEGGRDGELRWTREQSRRQDLAAHEDEGDGQKHCA
mmetsp:Transcript_75430/g.209548  ORF Transcript_75430/g.209548 Transcript_75430/m.209548 type:complete len:223 (+) Transcript_75430:184-852(+)